MILQYSYNSSDYSILVNWTDVDGHSVVFQDIISKLSQEHGPAFSAYLPIAQTLDEKADVLFKQFYIFTDETNAIPYNPKFRNQLLRAYTDICEMTDRGFSDAPEQDKILLLLYVSVLDKLQEMVEIYRLDNAYQEKHWKHRKYLETWAETTNESELSSEFEAELLQMLDISNVLDCLTECQRRRLVKHVLMKYTLPEIAEQENVGRESVKESIASAFKKIRSYFSNI